MAAWIDAALEADLVEGGHVVVELDGTPVAVFRVEGGYYAIENVCTHDGSTPLADGRLDGCEIICPRHGAHFCLKTGKVLFPPAYEPVATFPVRVEAGRVQVRDGRWD